MFSHNGSCWISWILAICGERLLCCCGGMLVLVFGFVIAEANSQQASLISITWDNLLASETTFSNKHPHRQGRSGSLYYCWVSLPFVSVQFCGFQQNFGIAGGGRNGYGGANLKLHLSVSTDYISSNVFVRWTSLSCPGFSNFDHLQRPAAETGCQVAGEGPFRGSRIETLFLVLCRRGTVPYFSYMTYEGHPL